MSKNLTKRIKEEFFSNLSDSNFGSRRGLTIGELVAILVEQLNALLDLGRSHERQVDAVSCRDGCERHETSEERRHAASQRVEEESGGRGRRGRDGERRAQASRRDWLISRSSKL